MKPIFTKSWVSPLMTVLFLAVAVTGVFMFFHIGPGYFKAIHKWISLGVVVVAAIHLCLNWRVLWGYLRTRGAYVAIAVGIVAIALVASMGPGGHKGGPPSGAPTQTDDRH